LKHPLYAIGGVNDGSSFLRRFQEKGQKTIIIIVITIQFGHFDQRVVDRPGLMMLLQSCPWCWDPHVFLKDIRDVVPGKEIFDDLKKKSRERRWE